VKAKLLRTEQRPPQNKDEQCHFNRTGTLPTVPAGTVIDHPAAWQLVRMGMAEPADDECCDRADMTPERMAAAQKAQEKVRLGIHPDDFQAFDAKLLKGYQEDGTWIPGEETDYVRLFNEGVINKATYKNAQDNLPLPEGYEYDDDESEG
jgi:hypothetical protein